MAHHPLRFRKTCFRKAFLRKGCLLKARLSLTALAPLLVPVAALAQQSLPAIDIGAPVTSSEDASAKEKDKEKDIVVTPDRVEEPLARTATAVSVVPPTQVEKYGALGFANALRGVPGLDVTEAGGVGGQTSVFLRGSAPGQTLVMIDGIRVGDPAVTEGLVDFGMMTATDVERIEVLRGPQSALYGSDAMGGVINIITRKGEGPPRASILLEGGAYGTAHTRAALSGRESRLSYAVSFDALQTQGFARYGYRIDRPLTIGDGVTPLPPLPPNDPARRMGGSARFGFQVTDDLSVEAGFTGYDNAIRFDNPYAFVARDVFTPENHSHTTFAQGYARLDSHLFDRMLHNRFTAYGNETSHSIWQTESCFDSSFNAFNCRNGYRGKRRGFEYQGDAKLDALGFGALGRVTFGAKNETESAHMSQDPLPLDPQTTVDYAQTTHSGFAQHQLTLFDRVDITYGGRIDAVERNRTFATWRTTAAYRIEETGTKIRGSAGTGAKAATLFQRFSQFGNPTLRPEYSIGYDVGVDQKLFGERATASLTLFQNRFSDLIDFGNAPGCAPTQVFGCYFNTGRAETKGIEFAGEAEIIPDMLRARASYTHLVAKNLTTQRSLYRRPPDKGMLALIYTGIPGLEFETRLLAVGETEDFDFINFRRVKLPAYARIDLYANYRIDERLSVFGRIENVGDVRYQEVFNYGTPGRSAYGGVKFSW